MITVLYVLLSCVKLDTSGDIMKALTIHDIQRIAIVKKTDTIFFTKVHLINQFFTIIQLIVLFVNIH